MGSDSFQGQTSMESGSNKLFLGCEADFLGKIDMSVFDCLDDECETNSTRKEEGVKEK